MEFISYPYNNSIDHSDIYEMTTKFADTFQMDHVMIQNEIITLRCDILRSRFLGIGFQREINVLNNCILVLVQHIYVSQHSNYKPDFANLAEDAQTQCSH